MLSQPKRSRKVFLLYSKWDSETKNILQKGLFATSKMESFRTPIPLVAVVSSRWPLRYRPYGSSSRLSTTVLPSFAASHRSLRWIALSSRWLLRTPPVKEALLACRARPCASSLLRIRRRRRRCRNPNHRRKIKKSSERPIFSRLSASSSRLPGSPYLSLSRLVSRRSRFG